MLPALPVTRAPKQPPAKRVRRIFAANPLRCMFCGNATGIVESRGLREYVRRRRACLTCGERFTTYEMRQGPEEG